MKYPILVFCFFLMGCSNLTEKEIDILGDWEWELIDGEFKDYGFIKLDKNRKIAYKIASDSRTETLSYTVSDRYWRIKDSKICVAIEWKESLFNPEIIKEECIWSISNENDGKVSISLIGDFTQKRILLNRL